MTSAPALVPDVTLLDGRAIPQLGFGVFKVDDDTAETAVAHALAAGYRLIDTAKLYGNEAGVGRAVRASGLPREDVYVTTKIWNDDHGRERTLRAFDASVERLGLGVPDLVLIHWPFPGQDLYSETWSTLVELRDAGRVRSVGVSNFQPAHLARIIADSGVTPVVNQVELHPYLQQRALREIHAELGIATEAWSPLGRDTGLLDDPVLVAIAARHGVTPAQVVLRWHLDIGNIVIPKSVTPSRIQANLDVFDFALTEEDHEEIAGLDRGARIGPDPDVLGA
ncbi:aldo/keto reductase [Cellulomonas chengniuliangii]|uniref:Aldo/keto reductase n=1 Tax=Cellulomonas chengniuliangii TaxID=2968084 RepID=A0ABY5L1H8_9CELL|nr:aldo/keto reductase [Cellulomonas chengniuliangii]MCC2308253.1 aldo/keto reductase [Cellulomonas chengniuliangii]MCC2317260.1 aldo/keto reductase [Cellulomonas chengniuliangii]UUI76640.1 aldo/keto reductase [Cellulomonas chengniuliangii]